MVNKPLIRPYFLGGVGIGGVPLDSHDLTLVIQSASQNMKRNKQNTVDGRKQANQLIGSLSHLQNFTHPRWLFQISSINSIILPKTNSQPLKMVVSNRNPF